MLLQTTAGRRAREFCAASALELKKISWPTRAEGTQTAFAVILMAVIFSLILWGFDSLFVFLIGIAAGGV